MRVITGRAKGVPLRWPKEPRIRPTTDRTRQAAFSALAAMDIDWSRVLDLYAGTGALGIEALSRGADRADFVESDPRCCEIIRENLRRTGFSQQGIVHRMEALRALKTLEERYGIVFLDPPYSDEHEQGILEEVMRCDLLAEESTIVMEHPSRREPKTSGGFQLAKRLRHGDTCVSIFQPGGGDS